MAPRKSVTHDSPFGREPTNPSTLLSVEDLTVVFDTEDGIVRAVTGVSFAIRPREVFCIVGESGSGKTVTAMSILGLLPRPPARIDGGRIVWREREDLLRVGPERLRQVRGGEIGMVFQDPLTALNPVYSVGSQITEVLHVHRRVTRAEARRLAAESLDLVGIPRAVERLDQYPHELSGGMRQRAMIAMAIACRPALLIADEPTTALDVTVQAQVLEVLLQIKDEIDSAILLITHDLGVVAGVADRVMVMYAGRPVEAGTADSVFYDSGHPYTEGLLESVPVVEGQIGPLRPIPGNPPSVVHLPSGCSFHPRCRYARPGPDGPCTDVVPALRPVGGDPGHDAACHFAGSFATPGHPPTPTSTPGSQT